MLFGMLSFIERVLEHDQHMMAWFLSLPLALAGVLMVLYGVGEWGRWGYLIVFLSIPATFIGYCFLFPHNGKDITPFVITGVVAFFALASVRGFYERRAKQQTDSAR